MKHTKLFNFVPVLMFSAALLFSTGCTLSTSNPSNSGSNSGNSGSGTTGGSSGGSTGSGDSGNSGSGTEVQWSTTVISETETDFGNWGSYLTLEGSLFSNLTEGGYITVNTSASATESSATYFQIKFQTNENNTWTAIGDSSSCEGTTSYSSEYETFSLSSASATVKFTPSATEIESIKNSNLIINGYGITVSKVTLTVKTTSSTSSSDSDLSDSNATDNAKKLYAFLKDSYGSKVITGQMENAWNDDCNMLNRVYNDTGKYPALMGFDFINYTSLGWTANNVQTERAIKFWNGQDYDGNTIASGKHGIVAFMWHWRDPCASSGTTGSFAPGDGTSDTTAFRIPYDTTTDSWNTSSTEYTEMMADLDTIAAELAKLQTAGVPVLWRPLHEGAGNLGGSWTGASAWFWWGAGNESGVTSTDVDLCAECYIALWQKMYTYFTETKGLHNLIWVWNGQNKSFYPGSAYVDIIGDDIYESYSDSATSCQVYNTNKTKFNTFQSWDTTKLTALTECGNLPDVTTDGALWSYFMIWNDGATDDSGSTVTTDTSSSNFWSGTFFNTAAKKKEIFVTNETALTLDELPDLTSYSD